MEDTSVDKVLFQSDSRSKEAFVKMAEFRSKNQLTDITLVAGPKRITAHKVVIASLCDYFSAMFTNDLSETTQNEVTLNNVDPDALQALIDYAYSSELEIRVDNVESLLASACLLQIPDVKIACCDFMKNQLHPSNCLGIRAFADAHGCDLLFKIADDFTKDHFLEVSKNQEFLLLSADQLCEILASDDLNVSSEEYVFRSVDLWLRYDMEDRNNFACQVIRCVRLPLLSPQFLVDEMESLPALRNSPNCKDILLETMKYHLLPERRKESKGLITRPRKGTVGVLYAIGGMDSIKGAAVCIEEFNPRINKWKEVAVMGTRRLQFGVAVLDGRLYITGGRDGLKTLNNVECYDPKTGTWSTLPPMLTHRHGVGVAVLSGPIYAVGGHDGWSYLNTVERFDPQAQQWSFVCSMNSPRSTVGVAVLEGKLYAVGGRDGSACLSSVEVYDPHTNKWTMAAPMLKRRGGVGVSILSGFLYAVGGHDAPASQDSSKQFCSVERYDPISDQWTLVAPMNYCRDAVGLASLGDRLFSVGGYDGTKYLDAVECYDPEKNEWETVAPLTHSRAGACVVAIKVS